MPRRRLSNQFRHYDPFAAYSDIELEHEGEGWTINAQNEPSRPGLPPSISTRGILHTPGGGINVTGSWRPHAFNDTLEGMGDDPEDWETVMGRVWDDFTVSPLLEVPLELVGEHFRRDEHNPTGRPRMKVSVQQYDTSQVPRWSDPISMVQAFGDDVPADAMKITGKPPPPTSPHGQTYSEGYWHEPPLNPATRLLPEDTDMSAIGSFTGEWTADNPGMWTPDRAKGILTWDEDPAASIFEGISGMGNTTMDVVADPQVLRYRKHHNVPGSKEQASSAREVTAGPNFETAINEAYRYVTEEHQRYLASLHGDYFDQGTGAQDFGEEPEETETAKQIKGAFSGIGEAILAATTRAATPAPKAERPTIKMDKPEMEIDSGQPEMVDERHPVTGTKTGRKVVKDAPYFEKPPPPKRERPTIKMKPNRQARADKKTYDEEGTGSQDFDQRMEKFDDMWPSEGSLTHGDPRLDKHARTMWAAGGIHPGTDLEDMRQEITRRYPRAFPNDV